MLSPTTRHAPVTFSRRWLGAVLAIALLPLGCSSQANDVNYAEIQKREVNQQVAGVWRLMSYVPDEQLSVALLLSMQSDRIVVRFEDNRIKSATSLLTFDRAYRIDSVYDNGFKLFIQEDNGVEYEVFAKLDKTGRLLFEARTAPWRGSGVLEREGSAFDTQR